MLPFTNINFYNFWVNNTPSHRRKPKRNARGRVYMRPLVWLLDWLFGKWMYANSTYPFYQNGTTYNALDCVVYNYQLYQVLEGFTVTSVLPTDATRWRLLNKTWVGYQYRINATAQKEKLEYYLNLYFQATYRNAPSLPDIYITTNATPQTSFYVGYDEPQSCAVTYLGDDYNGSVAYGNPAAQANAFTINIPTTVWNRIASSTLQRTAIVRSQVDPRNLQSLKYNITTY